VFGFIAGAMLVVFAVVFRFRAGGHATSAGSDRCVNGCIAPARR
jgi:hypothetical protein